VCAHDRGDLRWLEFFGDMHDKKKVAKAAGVRSDLDHVRVKSRHLAALCSIIRRSNARAILLRSPEDSRGRPWDSALSALAAFADNHDAD
jgi:hypothetical protein